MVTCRNYLQYGEEIEVHLFSYVASFKMKINIKTFIKSYMDVSTAH